MAKKTVAISIGSAVGIVILGVVAFFGVNWFNQGSLFTPGSLVFTDEAPEAQRTFINEYVNSDSADLKHDVTISVTSQTTTTADTNYLLYDIRVPITDFYSPVTSISATDVTPDNLISILELTPEQKLLALDDIYYLDTLDSGAFFDYLVLTGDAEDVVKITTLLSPHLPEFPTSETLLTFAQTGVTALSRGMNAKLSQVGDATYFAEKIAPFLSSFDLTHTSNEASFTPFATDKNICSNPKMIDTLTSIGLDIVELTGNHNQDCGDTAALDTLSQYAELGIRTVGGGATATLAAEPLLINEKGSNITLLGYNLSTGGYTLDATPGANFYTKEKALADITAAKARGDTVIIDIQYYECNNYDNTTDSRICDYANSAAGDQIGFFRELIDMGADVVIGTAAHQPQTYELYNDGVIYYGLGNLFFDQIWWPGTTRSLILVHYFFNNHLIQTRIVPTIYDQSMQTTLMDTASAEAFLERLIQARP